MLATLYIRRRLGGGALQLLEILELLALHEFVDTFEVLGDLPATELIDLADEAIEEVTVVRDEDERAIIVEEGLLEDFLRLHVKVVRRFVENQQVIWLEEELEQSQARALTTAEYLDLLRRSFTTEHEGAEEVLDLRADLALGYIVDGLEDGARLILDGRLILGEVADLDIMPEREGTFVLQLLHNAAHEGTLPFPVLPDEGNLVATLDHQVDIREDALVTKGLTDALHLHGIVARAWGWWEAQADSGGIDLVDLDQLELLKHTYTALHLVGLGVCTLEALDEVGRLSDELLLLLVGLHLLLATLGTQALVLGVVHLIVVEAAHRDLEGTRGDMVDESAVVADDDDRLTRLDEEVLEPLDRLDVEVVRRLVEEEDIGLLQEELCQLDTHTPAPTELARLSREVASLEAKTEERQLDSLVVVDLFDSVVLLTQCRHLLDDRHILGAIVVSASIEGLVELLHTGCHLVDVAEGLLSFLEDGAPVFGEEVLGKVGHLHTRGDVDLTAGRLTRTAEDLQQGALTGTILPHEGDAVLGVDDEGNI